MLQDPILERVERCEVHVAAFGRDDLISACTPEQARNAKAGAGSDDRDHACVGQTPLRAANVAVSRCIKAGDGMRDCSEIVDDYEALDAEPLKHKRGADDPRIIGELQHVAADGARKGDRQFLGKRLLDATAEFLPRMLEACEFAGFDRHRLAEVDYLAVVDRCQRETCMRSTDVGSRNHSHPRFLPIPWNGRPRTKLRPQSPVPIT